MSEAVLALNAGSSSVKFALFEAPGLEPLWRGEVEIDGEHAAFADLFEEAETHLGGRRLLGVGHRIVHGGVAYSAPVRIEDAVLADLDRLCPLAPLHQPAGLGAVRAVARLRPDLAQTASFDTAFHHGHAPVVTRFALPRAFEAEGVRRYGFHGLSYDYVSNRLRALDPALARGRVIAAHLGSGASLCAMSGGESVDTTMGFSALDGLVMGTRPGLLDPGVVLYLLQEKGMDAQAVSDLLYRRSGLLGVSGLSADMRALLESAAPEAKEAVDLFVFRIAREVGALVSILGGLDGLVFTAGIGEHAPRVRGLVCERLGWLGCALDETANARGGEARIEAAGSRLKVWVIPTDEECVIARDAVLVLATG